MYAHYLLRLEEMILRCGRLRLPKHSGMFQPLRMFDFFGDRQQTFQNAKSGYLECYIGHLERDTNSPTNKTDEPSKRRWPPKPWQPRHPSSPYLRATTRTPRRAIPNNYVAQKKQSPKKSSPHHNNKALFLLLPRQYRNGTQQKVWG